MYQASRQLPQNLDLTASRSCKNVIVTVEELVSREYVIQQSHRNVIPRFRTTAIVEAPYGAHPSSCMPLYDNDREHVRMYAQMARDPNEFRKYLDKYVYGVESHMDYLELVGLGSLIRLRNVGGIL